MVSIDEQVQYIVHREGMTDVDGYELSITSYTGEVETRITLVRTNGSIVDYTYPGDAYDRYQRDTSISGSQSDGAPYQLENPFLMGYTVASLMQHGDRVAADTLDGPYAYVAIYGFDSTSLLFDYAGRGACFEFHTTGDVIPMPEC